MNNEELIACIRAEAEGKRIEFRDTVTRGSWVAKRHTHWDTTGFEYRIAKEPRVLWGVMDKDGDVFSIGEHKCDAEAALRRAEDHGRYAPYTLCRIEEVL